MKQVLPDLAPALTVRDLAHYLKVKQGTVYRLIKAGQLPAFRVGRDWRFSREAIDRWRIEHEIKPRA
jgi:excisionase family DNA binding protein